MQPSVFIIVNDLSRLVLKKSRQIYVNYKAKHDDSRRSTFCTVCTVHVVAINRHACMYIF